MIQVPVIRQPKTTCERQEKHRATPDAGKDQHRCVDILGKQLRHIRRSMAIRVTDVVGHAGSGDRIYAIR
jgi:hypothetical protein